ncbi:MAG: universal stress protein [Pseudomonadota bacterium]
MGYQNILLHLPLAANELQMRLAFAFAKAFESHVTGICILPDTAMSQATVRGPLIQNNETDAFEDVHNQRAEAVSLERCFDRAADQLGVSHDWLIGEGDAVDVLIHVARLYDLVIVPRLETKVDLFWGPATQLALSGRPTLIVPREGPEPNVPTRILVAWNGSAPAAAAIRGALPLLKAASEVVLLAGKTREDFPSWMRIPPTDMAAFLHRNRVNVDVVKLEAPESEAGSQIVETAEQRGADLIVMGAFGRSRFREWVLGGATRHVLEHMTTPVLMAH